jgi:hypothetical protein
MLCCDVEGLRVIAILGELQVINRKNRNVRGKGKRFTREGKWAIYLVQPMKTYKSSGGIDPRIFNFATRWNCVVKFTLRPLYLRAKFLVSIERGTEWVLQGY